MIGKNTVDIGTISYFNLINERSKGEKGLLCLEVQFTYEMEIPADLNHLIPVPGGGEVKEFLLVSIEELKRELAHGVTVDLLLRMERLCWIS